ncbi:MAG: peptidoglycan-binding protein [Clostridiales bacterium]|jgi:peptidoglycan hydrolase-like protein with peptidoglycan-binding domain|nr:peptidoglycan-binding protein [Clostridiales bacterium]
MGIGYLKIELRLAGDALPAAGIKALIKNENNVILYELVTSKNGITEYAPLEVSATEIDGVSHRISYFNVEILGGQQYGSVFVSNAEVYDGLSSTLPIDMRPYINGVDSRNNTRVIAQPREHACDYRSDPEAAAIPNITTYGMTNTVVIPEYITVHLGYYTNAAENIRVRYKDYLKNVAASEIYADWHEAALYANIYCQISYTLNRLYTVWYRSQGYNFDITNSTQTDQAYTVGKVIPDNISRIVDNIFNIYLRREGRNEPYFAAYCDGKHTKCKFGLWQWQSDELAQQGYSTMQILHYYYPDDLGLAESNVFTDTTETYPGYALRQGMSGDNVKLMQDYLNRISGNYYIPKISNPNGVFDEQTKRSVEAFQSTFNLDADGIIGKATWNKITYIYAAVKKLGEEDSEGEYIGISKTPPTVTIGSSSDYNQSNIRELIAQLQFLLNYIAQFYNNLPYAIEDSRYTQTTLDAVISFQAAFGLPVTGIVNQVTWQKLYQVYWSIQGDLPPYEPEPPIETPDEISPAYPGYLLKQGSTGENVRLMQQYLNALRQIYPSISALSVDGQFGLGTKSAVIAFQQLFGLSADGIIGRDTWNKIVQEYNNLTVESPTPTPAYPGYLISYGSQGQYVLMMQEYLNAIARVYSSIPTVTADGKFGTATRNAVIAFQRLFGLTSDGIIGQDTWNRIVYEYNKLQQEPSVPSYPAYPGYLISYGSQGEYVRRLQSYLNEISRFYPSVPSVTADGIFGAGTRNAVIAFQNLFGLSSDGIVGEGTWNRIMSVYYGLSRTPTQQYTLARRPSNQVVFEQRNICYYPFQQPVLEQNCLVILLMLFLIQRLPTKADRLIHD